MQGVSLCGDLVISIATAIAITSPTPIAVPELNKGFDFGFFLGLLHP
jgi:hypothetical protein